MALAWNHTTFTQLFAQSPKQAFEYRFAVLGDPIPAEYLDKVETVEEKELTKVEKLEEIVINLDETVEDKELTREEKMELLTQKGVEFKGNISNKALNELIDNL